MSTRLYGYDIRIQREGSTWLSEKAHGWSPKGSLPVEWSQVKASPDVVHAVIFRSTQRSKPSNKRVLAAEYTRKAASSAAIAS